MPYYPGINGVRYVFIYFSAAIVIVMALIRMALLLLEIIQLIRHFPGFIRLILHFPGPILDWINVLIKAVLFPFSIIFVWVFHTDCLCPLRWQWQIGALAVCLGWIILVFFISKFPLIGIYVLMFVHVFKTFLKVLILAILLVVGFALTFYLVFTEPGIEVMAMYMIRLLMYGLVV